MGPLECNSSGSFFSTLEDRQRRSRPCANQRSSVVPILVSKGAMAFSRPTRRLTRQTRAIGSGPTAVNAQIGSRLAAVRILLLKTRRSEEDLEANTHTHSGKARFCRKLRLPLITVPERKVILKSPLCRVSVVANAVRRTRCERCTRTFDMLSADHVRVSGSSVPITYLPAQGG